jgi:response regulator RpfG family c-di-GMP phosphodiesterase
MAQIVLLAVNDPDILYLLRRYVEESGLRALVSRGGEDLEGTAARAKPSLIIVDGIGLRAAQEALQAIRDDPNTRDIPILVYGSIPGEPLPESAPGISQITSGCLQDYVLYDQFLAALRRFGVQPEGDLL